MKKSPVLILYAVAVIISAFSCMNGDNGNISLNFNESGHYYSMNARFSKHNTRDVEEYMDDRIGKKNNLSFVNSQIDGILTLDDHTSFYIKKSPGILKIKFDKYKNSDQAYERIRLMCEGIKKVLAK